MRHFMLAPRRVVRWPLPMKLLCYSRFLNLRVDDGQAMRDAENYRASRLGDAAIMSSRAHVIKHHQPEYWQ